MKETVKAKMQLKDADGNSQLDEEGKVLWEVVECEYDFGDNLEAARELCGDDVVFSQYKANAKVGCQSIMRSKMAAGLDAVAIQATLDAWKPGMVAERTTIDPLTAVQGMFKTMSEEDRVAFLAKLGVEI